MDDRDASTSPDAWDAPSPSLSPQEQEDMTRAINLSLEDYQHQNVLLSGFEAQRSTTDLEKDFHRASQLATSSRSPQNAATQGFSSSTTSTEPSTGQDLTSPALDQDPQTPQGKVAIPRLNHGTSGSQPSVFACSSREMESQLFLLNEADADTLVFIDAPTHQPEMTELEYKYYKQRCDMPHRVHSKKFLRLGSAYFEAAFGPTKQFRVIRRRGLANNLPSGIKYVLDLTPPTEGEDAAYLMTELSCSIGIRKWFQAEEKWGISKALIGGRDEFEGGTSVAQPPVVAAPDHEQHANSQPADQDDGSNNTAPAKKIVRKINWDGQLPEVPAETDTPAEPEPAPASPGLNDRGKGVILPGSQTTPLIPLDYTPPRHRSAIERVLHAIEGKDPKLDSAPKIWTFFAIAKYFDCATHPSIVDWIVRWMYASPNSYFIELHPDVTSKIADGIQCLTLRRDTYAILVGEEALDNARRTRDSNYRPRQINSYGRIKEDLLETDQTRLEYGSKSFLERIWSLAVSLVDDDMMWLLDLPEFRRVHDFKFDSAEDMEARDDLINTLKDYIRGRIVWTFCRNHHANLAHLKSSEGNQGRYPTTSYNEVYNKLELRERIFTRSAWVHLKMENFGAGDRNLWTDQSAWSHPSPGFSALALKLHEKGFYREVTKSFLKNFSQRFLQVVRKKESKSIQQSYRLVTEPSGLGKQSVNSPLNQTSGYSSSQGHALPDRTRNAEPSNATWENTSSLGTTLPDRTRKAGDIADLEQFEELSVHSPTKPADSFNPYPEKRRKVSETEEVLISLTNKDTANRLPTLNPQGDQSMVPKFTLAYYTDVNFEELARVAEASKEGSAHTSFQTHIIRNELAALAGNRGPPANLTIGDKIDDAHYFSLHTLFTEANDYMWELCNKMLAPANQLINSDALNLQLTDTLVCLEESEWKYLPLWAGGCDDGSGGVFEEPVPIVENGGFSAPGPSVHTGSAASSSASTSSFEVIDGSSTSRNTSTVVQDGFSDSLERGHVYGYDANLVFDEVMAQKAATFDKGKGVAISTTDDDAQTMIMGGADQSGPQSSIVKTVDVVEEWDGTMEEDDYGSDIADDDNEDQGHDSDFEGDEDEEVFDTDSDSDLVMV